MSSKDPESALVVGAGIFGVTAARELRGRGLAVTLIDPGPLPHPDAASTDISKVVRADYGADGFYVDLMEEAFSGWARWNHELGRAVYHETGFLLLSSGALSPGGFEHDSHALLSARGYPLERLDSAAVSERFPAWRAGRFVDGYLNPRAGWVESGEVVTRLLQLAERDGVTLREGARVAGLVEDAGRVRGVRLDVGDTLHADHVVLCAGTWTQTLVPELTDRLGSVGQPVLHFSPRAAHDFTPPGFLPWAADISTTGWYGFATIGDVVKVANHGPGVTLDPSGPRQVAPEADTRFRAFLADALPGLAAAPIAKRRLCLYSDCFDGDFFIARHPQRTGLTVAAGGSGHAFKFGPVLGPLIADVCLGQPNPWAKRFAWRARGARRTEQARWDG